MRIDSETLIPREIRVGIRTEGAPRLTALDERRTLLENMVIGKGFHWQRTISCILPGKVEILENDPEGFTLVNSLPVDLYVECVAGSEMNPHAPTEFLKAQAIVARSWALGKMMHMHPSDCTGKIQTPTRIVVWEDTTDHPAGCGFDLCNDDHCQRYQGLQPQPQAMREAFDTTRGLYISCDGLPVDARFSKCCGGSGVSFGDCWEPSGPDYFTTARCPCAEIETLAPEERRAILRAALKEYDFAALEADGQLQAAYSEWETQVDPHTLIQRLRRRWPDAAERLGELTDIRPGQRGHSEYADAPGPLLELQLTGTGGTVSIGKELAIRRLLAADCLKSSRIRIEKRGPGFRIVGRGWGHGVGMCQIGAAYMAARGASASGILKHYYPGTTLMQMPL